MVSMAMQWIAPSRSSESHKEVKVMPTLFCKYLPLQDKVIR